MTNKHRKTSLNFISHQGMEIKITMIYVYLSEWLKQKYWKYQMLLFILYLSCMADRDVKWYSHSGKEFGNFNKLKHTHTIWPSSWTGHLSQINENLCGMKTYTQMSLAVLFVIAPSWKQPRCPAIEWVVQHPFIPWNTTLQWKGTDCWYNLDGPERYYDEWKKTVSKGHILYDCIYIAFLKWQNYRNEEQINGCQG